MTDLQAETSSGPANLAAREMRAALAGDRHRPLYHFLAPANWTPDF